MPLFLKRCTDTYNDDRGLIIPIVDNDLINLLENMKGQSNLDSFLSDRFREVALT